MPYIDNSELPTSIKNVLPNEAQTIFRINFNDAWSHKCSETNCFVRAWAAVKRDFYKPGKNKKWVPKEGSRFDYSTY